MVTVLIGIIVYQSTQQTNALIWVAVMCTETIICLSIFKLFVQRNLGRSITQKMSIVVVLLLVQSISYTYLPYAFIPNGEPEIVILLSMVSAILAAGSVALSSPFFIGFIASSYPSMLVVSLSLYLRDEPLYQWLALAFTLMLMGLTWFAMALTRTIQKSVETSLENTELVKELRSALSDTDEANRAKSVFLASASHDLRQPLHAIGLLNESLGRTQLNPAQLEIHQHFSSALSSTREMLDALLNISKLDAGAISPQPKPFLIRTILNKLEAELAPTADEKNLLFRVRESIAAANSDPFIVELILRNLIANAIRYTDEGGLLIGCRKDGDCLSIEVWDTGIGIKKNQYDTVFKPFQQLGNPERDSRKGFGLGLAIAQGLAQTIGTQIRIQSKLGKGSVFSFSIPRATEEVIEDIAEGVDLGRFDGTTVMVVDDDPHILASMKSVLTAWGCHCILAETAKEALEAPNAKDTQLLLTDYRLRQKVTGKDVVQIVRSELQQNLPAIIVTGDTAVERIRDAQSSDALLLHKPASAAQLHLMMSKLLKEPRTFD